MKPSIKFPDFEEIEVKGSRPLWHVCRRCLAHYRAPAPAGNPSPRCPSCGSWKTDDTCPGCGHDGMTFTPDEDQIELDHGVTGTLTCPACGWFDELAMTEEPGK